MTLTDQITALYRRRAKNYDLTANLYYLMGYREWAFRRKAVAALHLRPGDTVIEIGCGTGLNFGLYQDIIGPEGAIIGIDLTDAMLEQARRRVERQGWRNVELIHGDALHADLPAGVNGVISTFALSLIPEADQVIERGSRILVDGGRCWTSRLRQIGLSGLHAWRSRWLRPSGLSTSGWSANLGEQSRQQCTSTFSMLR